MTSKNAQPARESATGGLAHQHGRQVADCEKVHQTALVPQQEGVTSAPRVSHAARAYPYSPGRPPTLIQGAGLAGGPCQPGHNGKDRVWWRHIVNEEGRLLCVTGIQERVCIIYQRECIISGCNKDAGSETPVGPEMESAAKKPNRQLTSCGGRSLLSTDGGYLVPPITTHQSPT